MKSMFPILVLGKRALVSRHADVIEVLTSDTDFTIARIAYDGPFPERLILEFDRD